MPSRPARPAPLDYNAGGFVGLGIFRLRPVIFGICVLEEMHQWADGRQEWLRAHRSVAVSLRSRSAVNAG
jgi:hypothetical protein